MSDKERLEQIKFNNKHSYCDKNDVDFLLNLIEKQNKEIEQLKIAYKLMEKEALRDGKQEIETKDKMIDKFSKACYLTWRQEDYDLLGIEYNTNHQIAIKNIVEHFKKKAE